MNHMLALHYWSIAQLQAAYRCGELTPSEVTQKCIERIACLNPDLHAFILTLEGEALARAAAIDLMKISGVTSPLAGIPYSIKDNFDVRGLATTCHSKSRVNKIAEVDSQAHTALEEASAILLGKNSMHELATGGPSFDLPWPPARNPWNKSLHPGGSSSGSGVAVAAGMAYFSLGTDTGGSVRHPATACGIFGFKPTRDIISTEGIIPLSKSLDHAGVLARSPSDIAVVMAAVSSTAAERARYASLEQSKKTQHLREFSVGVIDAFSTDLDAHPDIAAAFDDMVAKLGRTGCHIRRIPAAPLGHYNAVARDIIAIEAHSYHGSHIEAHPRDFGARTRTRIEQGKKFSAAQYASLCNTQRRLSTQLHQAMDQVDVAMTLSSLHFPCAITDADAIDTTYNQQARTPFNLTGMPAIAVPTGVNMASLPLGLQFAATCGRDVRLLEFCMALEKEGFSTFIPSPEHKYSTSPLP